MMIDIHAHILPGMDDGPASIEESLAICRMAADDGIKKIVATPHIYDDLYKNNRDNILEKVKELNRLTKEEGIDIEILPGADIHFSPRFFHLLDSGYCIGINDSKYLLIEFSQVLPPNCEDLIFNLKAKGYIPIISHPERNFDIQRRPDGLNKLIEIGALAQLTAMSLTGGFGHTIKRSAHSLLNQGLIHIIATDTHSVDERPPILSEAFMTAKKAIGEEEAYNMVYHTPMKIIGESKS